eukprot:TRINITY_DN30982_c0_g1_i1.p3 TRINITY_DN30982_c0_g1~~TRINITY_DN30982_c0_g1_i1.p3  ORF type:complete len:107 (+),score=2.32 TRINITY_DN30982_c0_g1_i1:291-611(+)
MEAFTMFSCQYWVFLKYYSIWSFGDQLSYLLLGVSEWMINVLKLVQEDYKLRSPQIKKKKKKLQIQRLEFKRLKRNYEQYSNSIRRQITSTNDFQSTLNCFVDKLF